MKRLTLLACLVLLAIINVRANNIEVSSVSLTDQSASGHYCNVKFNISWDNSWRTSGVPQNWDAAWVFVKYRLSGGPWQHATLNTSGHTSASGSTITASADGKGIFIYRSTDGSGTNSWTNNKIRWNYGNDGVADDASLEVSVLAIEMVYIPQGSFYIGDGNGSDESQYAFHTGTGTNAVQITSSLVSNIRVSGSSAYDDAQLKDPGIGIDGDGGIDTDNSGSIDNPDYPTGYQAIYSAKYEISQEQYVDFLNMLTRNQQITRVQSDISGTFVSNTFVMTNSSNIDGRCGIRCNFTLPAAPGAIEFFNDNNGNFVPNETTDGQTLPLTYATWMDLAAYADWTGLRPMTELEFEKICRGPNNAVYGEFAWGTTNIHSSSYNFADYNAPTEGITDPGEYTGNAIYNSTSNSGNPNRCGIFAYSAIHPTRQETGAGFYGVMEMTGNVAEILVNIGSVAGRSYRGNHGNGVLTASGDSDVDYWPGINGNTETWTANQAFGGITGVTGYAGNGLKGGSSLNSPAQGVLQTSSRSTAGTYVNTRIYTSNTHLVRTAP